MVAMLNLTINGHIHSFSGDPETPLLWVLRDELGLKGTKFGCGVGVCGICTVLIDGKANHACMVPVRRAADHEVVTIEGMVDQNHPLLHAWIEQQVPQCGYCQSGQIMAAAVLVDQYADPTDDQINQAMSSVLCRCGTYQRIRNAIHRVTQLAGETLPQLHSQSSLQDDTRALQGITFNKWIRISDDGTVTVTINHSEMGQGTLTGLAMLVAEELDVALAQVRTVFAPAATPYRNPLFGEQTTGGSTSIRGEWERLRLAGAGVRWRLVEAAAKSWGVARNECRTADGIVYHDASKRSLDYGALASDAVDIPAPDDVALKPAAEFRLLGHSQPHLAIPSMVTAQTVFGIDVAVPGMLFASVERRPLAESRLQALDDSDAKAVTGVVDVVAIDSGFAVLANNTWAAIQGRNRLRVTWDIDKRPGSDNASYRSQLAEAIKQQGDAANKKGNAKRALLNATDVIESVYETGFLAHATLEPMNCTARVNGERCDVWVGTQSQESARDTAARISGLPKNKTYIHSLFIGGGFGRRLESDYVADAVELARQTNRPVQVLWSRMDDMQHDFYRPAHMTVLKAALDQHGWPEVWWQRGAGSAMALDMVQVPYAITNFADERVVVEPPLPAGAWRSVAAGQSAFVVESFIDELAQAAGRDPLEYRLQLLSHDPRSTNVLQHAANKAAWHVELPQGHYQGIACYQCFGSWVAQVAELSVDQSMVTIHRIVCVVDCGQVVNPDAVCAQMEGAIAMGLSAAFKEQVLFRDGRVTQVSLEDYPILCFAELPEIDVYIVPSHEPPGGVGEPGLPPLAPAVGNAIFAATGKRFRALPFPFTIAK